MGNAEGGGQPEGVPPPRRRRSLASKRIDTILAGIPGGREQLAVAMEDLGASFELDTLKRAARSGDPRERNKVAVVVREFEVLANWLDELTDRALAEGQRLEVVPRERGHGFERLRDLGAISARTAQRLQEVKELRDLLQHAYPPRSWEMLHAAVETLWDELDRFVDRYGAWTSQTGIRSREHQPPPARG